MMADEVRRRLHGVRTTFLRVYEIHVDAPPVALPPGVQAGEYRIVGQPSSIDAAVAAVHAAARLGGPHVRGFSLADLVRLGAPDVFAALRQAGLHAIAEVPIDLTGDADAVGKARAAGLTVDRLTVQAGADRSSLEIVTAAAALQRRAGGFRAFAPLARGGSIAAPTTGYDDVKRVALARLAAGIDTIQVDWALYGPKLAQVALTVGADDVDGVAAVEPGLLGTRRSAIEEIRGNIRAAGLEPVERNGRFELLGRRRSGSRVASQ
jgi:aminodeoxyfutalosine synthase